MPLFGPCPAFFVHLSGAGDAERAVGDVLACQALRTIIDPLQGCRDGEAPQQRQSPTLQQTLSVVEAENTGGRLANIGQRYDGDAIRIIQTKMVAPGVQARVIKSHQQARFRDQRGDVAALVPVAGETCIRQVIFLRPSAVLLADDMVNLKAEKRVILMDQAVFTHALGPRDNEAAEDGADVSRTQVVGLLPGQVPPCPRFGEAHQVLQTHIVV